MKKHQMKLMKTPLEKMKRGDKIIEARLFDEKRQKIRINDSIEFAQNEDETDKILTKVVGLYRYKTFDEMFSDLPIEYFGFETKEDAMKKIRQIYTFNEENKFGVIGIKIKNY
ncbi:MAG: ASCH domain-containing protein [Patescibacteria group bacterium]